jgi:hypothetical protein
MNRVQLYRMQQSTRLIHGGYELYAHGRFAWLHRMLWRTLQRLGALKPSMNEYVDVLRLPLDNDSIFERIFESRRDLFARRRRPTEVLIGPNTLSELINCPELRDYGSPFSFTAHAGYDRTIFDLPIRVVPQMEGVLVLDERA